MRSEKKKKALVINEENFDELLRQGFSSEQKYKVRKSVT